MENKWNSDLSFSNKMQPSVDEYLNIYFNDIKSIDRLKDKNGNIFLNNGLLFTFQEKIRRNKYKRYQDFTLEYYSNVNKNIKGEFFHLAADYYITGYSDKNEEFVEEFRILDILKLKEYINNNFNNLKLKQNSIHSNANFFTISYRKLEKHNIVFFKKTIKDLNLKNDIKTFNSITLDDSNDFNR